MPLFQYQALDQQGKAVSATIDASSIQEVKEVLRSKNLIPAKIKETDQAENISIISQMFSGSIDLKTKVLFTRQLSVLLKASVPLLDAITLLIQQFESLFKQILINIRDDLKEGKSLADAMDDYPKVFDNVYIQLVRAGEASGGLEKILDRLTVQLERSEEIKKKVAGAMTEPIMMISLSFFIVLGASTFVIPAIADTLVDMKIELPGITKMLIGFSDLVLGSWYWIAGIIFVAYALFLRWKSTPNGRLTLDTIYLRLPLISNFSRIKAVVQFSNTLGMLMEAGVNLAEALNIVSNIVENTVIVTQLHEARDNIIQKGKIARFLQQTGIFPPIATYMIQTGEESGNLSEMLLQVGSQYEDELQVTTDKLTAAINPAMKLLVAGVVVLIALALFLPMMQMMDMGGSGL
jgi:type II secretory pathway component PulF